MCVCVFAVTQSCSTLWNPMGDKPLGDCSPPGSSVHRFSRQEYWSELSFPSPGDLPNLGTEPRSPALQADSLPSKLPGKPKNTGAGCRSLLQGISLTQGSNPGLLHCRRILYCLSHQESPSQVYCLINKYNVLSSNTMIKI